MSTDTPDPAKRDPQPEPAAPASVPAGKEPSVADGAVHAPAPRRSRRLGWGLAGLVVLAVLALAAWRLLAPRMGARAGAAAKTRIPTVPVAKVTRETLFNQVTIPAEFRPYQEVELHAKVSGYVKEMKVDFGDQVKSNQLLATLEVPELQDQLHNAVAVQQKAEADYRAAHLNYTRLLTVVTDHPNLVAQQDVDVAQAKDGIALAGIAAAKADVEKYLTLVGFTQITAPFDGVVTWRYVDQGALIPGGTSSESHSLPLLRISDNYHLRLDYPVSVTYVKDMKVGDTIDVLIESLGMKRLKGTVTRFARRVTMSTRTMITEIEVLNPTLEIVPGMYATVVLTFDQRTNTLAIPTEAVAGASGATNTVFLVNANHQVEERRVTLGLETPGRYEVLSGLREGDLVMTARRSLVQPGQKVNPSLTSPLAEQ